jgi:hypothetical protein
MSTQSLPTARSGPIVDVNALRTNQTLIVTLVVVAFVMGAGTGGAWLVGFVGLSLAIGTGFPGFGPFQLLYRRALRRAGIVAAKPRPDDPAPHRFAQALGSVFLITAAAALFAGATVVGWALAWLVVALALVNLLFGFCAGCFVFYHLGRLTRRHPVAP